MLKYFLAQSYPVTMIDDLLEAGRFIFSCDSFLTNIFNNNLTLMFLSLYSCLLADHLVLIVTLLHKSRLTNFFRTLHYE